MLLGDKVIWCVNASLPAPAAVVLRSGSISAGVVAAGMASNLPRRQLRVHRGPLPRFATRIRPKPPSMPPTGQAAAEPDPPRETCPPPHPSPASCPMNRPIALLAFLALSWSHVAAIRCATNGSMIQEPAETPTAHHHETSHPTGGESSNSHQHEDPERGECAMMLACAVTSGEPLRPADIRSFPGVAFQAGPFVQQAPSIVASSVDPPPPRHDI